MSVVEQDISSLKSGHCTMPSHTCRSGIHEPSWRHRNWSGFLSGSQVTPSWQCASSSPPSQSLIPSHTQEFLIHVPVNTVDIGQTRDHWSYHHLWVLRTLKYLSHITSDQRLQEMSVSSIVLAIIMIPRLQYPSKGPPLSSVSLTILIFINL